MAKELNVTNKKSNRGNRTKAKAFDNAARSAKESVLLPRNETPLEYRMSKILAADLLKKRQGEDKKMKPNDYLCKIVNQQFGLRGTCIYVHQD